MQFNKEFMVCQSNDFILNEKYKFELSLYEHKLISTIISLIKPDEEDFNTIIFKTTDLADLLNINYDYMYKTLPPITASLRSRTLNIMTEKGLRQMGIVDFIDYNFGEGTVTMKLSECIKPYLLRLKSFFIQYKLEYVLKLKSEYSFSLYELLKTEQFKRKTIFTLNKLKQVLVANKKSYNAYCHFKARILETAKKEINSITDIEIDYKEIKEGRKVVAIEFYIKNNNRLRNKNIVINEQIQLVQSLQLPIFSNNMMKKVNDWNIEKLKIAIVKFKNLDYKVKRFALLEKIYREDNNFKKDKESIPDQKQEKKLKFMNFDQRDYDYVDLEKKLLGWDD